MCGCGWVRAIPTYDGQFAACVGDRRDACVRNRVEIGKVAHLSNSKIPPRDTARRLVTHDLTQSPGTYRGLAADGHSCPLHLGARIGRV